MRGARTAWLWLLVACSSATSPGARHHGRPADAALAGLPTPAPPADGRLPADVRPERYALELAIDPGAERFSGTAQIRVALPRATDHVLLHGQGLSVTRAEIVPEGGRAIEARWAVVAEGEGLAAVVVGRPVGPGRVTLRIAWEAPFDEQLEGLYRVRRGGDAYAFTQFEAIWARRAFPCFDEPGLKAPFDVTLRVPRGLVAVGNTRVLDEHEGRDGGRVLRLAPTPPLPTYLVAWAVGPLDVVEAPAIPAGSVARPALPLRGLAPRGQGGRLAFALREAAAMVPAFERATGIAYPFDKLDLAALTDLEAGAMENAGLITFQDEYLLVDEATAGPAALADVSETIAHELAHQWYGNLVTAAWWDDLWLNESLATWMEVRLTEARHPEWSRGMETLRHTHEVMQRDALASARRLRQPSSSEHDIAGAFDWITYMKGAALLDMLERWLGAEVLTAALSDYLRAHRFGAATSADLVSAISRAAGRDLAPLVRGFLDQPGLPMIAAEPTCVGGRGAVTLRQTPHRPVGSRADAGRRWQVPVCLKVDAGAAEPTRACLLLDADDGRFELPGATCPRWVMPDADARGYYRWVLAGPAQAALVRDGLPRLSARERYSVGDALVAAVWAGRTPVEDALPLVRAFATDRDAAVARSVYPLFWALHEHLDDATAPRLEALVRRSVPAFAVERIAPSSGEPPVTNDEAARAELLALVGGDAALRRTLVDRGRRWLAGEVAAIAPELGELALALAASEGDEALFARLEQALFASADPLMRRRLLVALGSFDEPALARRALDLELDPRLLVGEMGTVVSTQLAASPTRLQAWQWMKARWPALEARLGRDLAAFWIGMAEPFCDAEAARDVRAFFEPKRAHLPGSPRELDNTIEAIELCAARTAAIVPGARQFLTR